MNSKSKIIEQAVNKLKKFGFVNVTADNIIEDEVYRCFFEKILEDDVGKNSKRDAVLAELLNEIEAANDLKQKITVAMNRPKKN